MLRICGRCGATSGGCNGGAYISSRPWKGVTRKPAAGRGGVVPISASRLRKGDVRKPPAVLLSQLIDLKILKYTKDSCNFQTSIWNKTLR